MRPLEPLHQGAAVRDQIAIGACQIDDGGSRHEEARVENDAFTRLQHRLQARVRYPSTFQLTSRYGGNSQGGQSF